MDGANSEHGNSVSISEDGQVVTASGVVQTADNFLKSISVYEGVFGRNLLTMPLDTPLIQERK